jgi:hypothetical protein
MPLSPLRTLRIPSEYALSFDGVDDKVRVPYSPSLVAFPVTMVAWLYHDRTQTWNRGDIVGRLYNYRSSILKTGALESWYYDGTVWRGGSFGVTIPEKVWKHVAFILKPEGTDTRRELYVDGLLVASDVTTGQPITTATHIVRIGESSPDYALIKGYIDEVCIYSRVLSADEIFWNYNYPYNPIRNGLVLWLSGTDEAIQPPTWYDKSNFGNNGTIYGAQKTQLIRKPVRTLAATRVLASVR